jgi:hypothetical protein
MSTRFRRSAGSNEPSKERSSVKVARPKELRVPLNGDNETVGGLHALNESVVSASGHSKVVPDLVYALVVLRVHSETTRM